MNLPLFGSRKWGKLKFIWLNSWIKKKGKQVISWFFFYYFNLLKKERKTTEFAPELIVEVIELVNDCL
jgi:hypothetical protein